MTVSKRITPPSIQRAGILWHSRKPVQLISEMLEDSLAAHRIKNDGSGSVFRGARMAALLSSEPGSVSSYRAVRFGDPTGFPMPLRETAPKLSTEQYEKNFADISPAMDSRQAAIEAERCLYCFDAPCIVACPTHIDVPAFIKKISTGNLRGSAREILTANILGHSCGRVCPTEALCEGACVMHEKGESPIEIGRLQRYAVDHVLDNKIQLFSAGAPNGKRVACVGSGPASLACAAELAKWGYDVTIFRPQRASWRPQQLRHRRVQVARGRFDSRSRSCQAAGREIPARNGSRARIFPSRELEKQFDAIFIGVGLGETWALNLPGEDLHGVYGAIEFIEKTKIQPVSRGRSWAVASPASARATPP